MRRLFGVSGSLGVLMTVESAIFAVPALSYFGLIGNVEKIYTFGFAYLNLAGVFTLMIVRERNHFWNSRPSKFLSITVLAEVLFVIAISVFGVLELAPLGYLPVLAILGYALLTTFVINDPIKVYLIRKFKTKGNFFGRDRQYSYMDILQKAISLCKVSYLINPQINYHHFNDVVFIFSLCHINRNCYQRCFFSDAWSCSIMTSHIQDIQLAHPHTFAALLWNFTTKSVIRASPAIVNRCALYTL